MNQKGKKDSQKTAAVTATGIAYERKVRENGEGWAPSGVPEEHAARIAGRAAARVARLPRETPIRS